MIDLIGETIKHRDIRIKYVKGKSVPNQLTFDQRRLQQVLLNLLSNAVKYSGNGSVIRIKDQLKHQIIPEEKLILEVVVEDNGSGIPT